MNISSKRSFVRQILSLFLLFHVLSLLVFNLFIFQENRSTALKNIDDSLMEIVTEKAQLISLTMQQIGMEAENLALWTEYYLQHTQPLPLSDEYFFSSEGILTRRAKQDHETGSSVFYPNTLPFDSTISTVTMATEPLDAHFARVRRNIPLISWMALPMESGFLRVYPHANMRDYYAPDHMQKSDPFYQDAMKNDSLRTSIWSDPYLDFMGTGWVITCSCPVIQEDSIIGFITLDVILETLQAEFLSDFRLGESGTAYLIQQDGAIICHPNVEPMAEQRGDMFTTSILEVDSLPESYRAAMSSILNSPDPKGIVRYRSGSDQKIIAYSYIEELSWIMLIEVSQSEFISMYPFSVGAIAILSLCLILITLFFSIFFLRYYSRPLQHLVQRAEKISGGDFTPDDSPFHHQEMQQLSHAFNFMSDRIDHRTQELFRKHQEIESIFNSIGGLLMIVDMTHTVLAINAEGAEWFQSTPDRLPGHTLETLEVDGTLFFQDFPIDNLFSQRPSHASTLTVGGRLYEIMSYPALESGNEVGEIILYGRDITEQTSMERELTLKEKMADIGQLSASIAHELKTPFSTIKGSLYLLGGYTKDLDFPSIHEQLALISGTLTDAEKIITNLLAFARDTELEISQVDIRSLIDQIVLIARKESDRMHIRIHTQVSQTPLYYHGMAGLLQQIMLNLVTNAMNALSQGGNLYLSAQMLQLDFGSALEIRVEDDGVGIAPERLEHIFDPFVTYSNQRQSTGLGLWITRRFIQKMKGEIHISSQLGVGTTVIITLPTK